MYYTTLSTTIYLSIQGGSAKVLQQLTSKQFYGQQNLNGRLFHKNSIIFHTINKEINKGVSISPSVDKFRLVYG